MTAHILVVDDDPVQRRLLKNAVERHGHIPHLAENGRAGLELLKRRLGEINVIVLDLVMPEMNGLGFLEALHDLGIDLPVIVQTGQGGIDTVVQAMRAGAFDFVVKPVSPERIANSIANALKVDQREAKARAGRRSRAGAIGFDDIVSASPSMLRVIELAQRAAQSNIPVVLEGESGVGKELVARAIQSGGDRAGRPFITVNCGAIPHNLVESILFGHEKGAFTGATERHAGKFVDADGGTLFLDEIGDLPLPLQAKLLRVLQEQEVEPLGSNQVKALNVRVIAATHIDLEAKVAAGQFRDDLYYRLNVLALRVPPLRERASDIPAVVEHLLDDIANRSGQPPMELSPEALALLCAQPWRGNVRELGNLLERAQLSADGPQLQAAHLLPLLGEQARSADAPAYASSAPSAALPTEAAPSEELPLQPLAQTLAQAERRALQSALTACKGNRRRAAMELGISRASLYSKLQQHGLSQR